MAVFVPQIKVIIPDDASDKNGDIEAAVNAWLKQHAEEIRHDLPFAIELIQRPAFVGNESPVCAMVQYFTQTD